MAILPDTRIDYGDPVARWFVTEGYTITDTAELVRQSAERLVAAGIPLYRLAYFRRTLHPELIGDAFFWRRGRSVEAMAARPEVLQGSDYIEGPLIQVFEQAKTIRVRLESRDEDLVSILRQLKQEGATDYVALPVLFSTGHVDALSVVSDRPGGFSSEDLRRMYGLEFLFARIAEIHSLRKTAADLLDAYVGRAAGRRILAGEIKRGDGQSIEAVIWYCDLRGFTRASDQLPRDTVIDLLNDWFGTMAAAVTAEGGEILKFMGDAMLAIFPVAAGERQATAGRALAAADAAAAGIETLNAARRADSRPVVRYGLALHIGEVMFGNIGAPTRLDFTVIGPAVNRAARLERLCGALDRAIVISAELAELLPAARLVSLGAHALRDIPAPQPVFALS